MAQATLTTLAIEKWLKSRNRSLFTNLHIPTQCDATKIKNAILYRSAPFEVVYPDPEFYSDAIDIWSSIKVDEWQKIADALEIEYSPLNNYDRTETTTDTTSTTHTGINAQTHSGRDQLGSTIEETISNTTSKTDTLTKSGTNETVGTDATTTSNNTTSEDKVSAYDAATSDPYVPKDRNTGTASGTSSSNTSTTVTIGGTDTNTISGTDTQTKDYTDGSTTTYGHVINDSNSSSDNGTVTRSSHISGNIGVTTSQQMLESEINLRLNNDMAEMIITAFIQEFCIMTY